MSKTAQRKESRRNEKQKRFKHGQVQAVVQAKCGHVYLWAPDCMAWRAGFLRAGGKKFW